MNYEDRPRKVHLYVDNSGRKNRGGKQVDNTLCASNHGNRGLLTTSAEEAVTCQRCLKLMQDRNPVAELQRQITQLETMCNENAGEANRLSDILDDYKRRVSKLEKALKFAIDTLGEEAHAIVHLATETTVGELLTAILNNRLEEPEE